MNYGVKGVRRLSTDTVLAIYKPISQRSLKGIT